MVYVATPSAVLRQGALAGGRAPRPLLPAGLALAPRARPFRREARRLLFQHAIARYVPALLFFPVAKIIWPELALPISQAPLLMLILVLSIETSVISIGSPEKRRALAPRDEITRTGDLLRARPRPPHPHRRSPRRPPTRSWRSRSRPHLPAGRSASDLGRKRPLVEAAWVRHGAPPPPRAWCG